MIIRQQQMEMLSHQMQQQFENRMVAHLRMNFPSHHLTANEQSLRTLIRKGIERTKDYDVVFEDDIRRFLEYMVVISPDFDANPATSWAGDILRSKNATGVQKMRRIDNVYVFSYKGRV
jgi:hypothetical protein